MAAVNITNRHDTVLTIGGVSIQPGRTAAIPHWERHKTADPVKSWFDLGLLEEDGKTPKPQDPEVVADASVQEASAKPEAGEKQGKAKT